MKKIVRLISAFLFFSTISYTFEVSANEIDIHSGSVSVELKDIPGIIEPSKLSNIANVDKRAVANAPVLSNVTEVKAAIEKAMVNLQPSIVFEYMGDIKQLSPTLLDTILKVREQNDYVTGVLTKYGYSLKNRTFTLNFEYTLTAEQQAYVSKEIDGILQRIITPSMSDLQKVLAINEYVVKHTSYSYETKTSPHASYALIKEGKGVCQAYAMVVYEMLTKAGLDAHYVTGFTDELHAWNMVKVDGEWYHLDSTWNDPVILGNGHYEDYISYEYMLLSDAVILSERQMDERVGLPKATSERFQLLRQIETVPVLYREHTYLITPKIVENELYYSSYSLGGIYRIDLSKSTLTSEKVASIDALDFVVTPYEIYFVDMKTLSLKKLNRASNEVSTLTRNQVHKLVTNDNILLAQYNGITVYEEKFIPYDMVTLRSKAKNIIQQTRLFGTERKIKDASKSWTITLSMNVKNDAANLQKIKVIDVFGETMNAEIEVRQNKVIVKPMDDYLVGAKYMVVIEAGLISEEGKTLNRGVYLPFVYSP